MKINAKKLAAAAAQVALTTTHTGATSFARIEARDGWLRLTTTNYDSATGVRVACEGELELAGVDPRLLADAAGRLGGEVELSLMGGLRLSGDRGTRTVPIVPAGDLPPVEDYFVGSGWFVETADMARVLRVCTCYSLDESRLSLNGVFFDGVNAVAVDGHRMHIAPFQCDAFAEVPFIVHRLGLKAWGKLVGMGEALYILRPSESAVVLRGVNAWAAVRGIEETFPQYQKVIPEPIEHPWKVNKAALAECLAVLGGFDGSKVDPLVEIRLEPERAHLSRNGADMSASAGCAAEGQSELRFGVKHAYIDEAVRIFEGETLAVDIIDQFNPIALKGDTGGALFIIMPMRL